MYSGKRLALDAPLLPIEKPALSEKPRIRFVSWKAGALSAVLLTELKQWLCLQEQQDISIPVVQALGL